MLDALFIMGGWRQTEPNPLFHLPNAPAAIQTANGLYLLFVKQLVQSPSMVGPVCPYRVDKGNVWLLQGSFLHRVPVNNRFETR